MGQPITDPISGPSFDYTSHLALSLTIDRVKSVEKFKRVRDYILTKQMPR